MVEPSAGEAREFRMAAEYRRCAWYLFGGTIVVVIVIWLLDHFMLVPGQPPRNLVLTAVVGLMPPAILLVGVNRWRLRIDADTVARRRFWSWDVWNWDDFAAAKVEREGSKFVSPSRPWWRRSITFDWLEKADRRFVLGACRYFLSLHDRPDEPLPGEIVVSYQLWRRITLRQNGLTGRILGRDVHLSWNDVQQVRLVEFEHGSYDLRRIEIDLPGKTLRVEGVQKVTNASSGESYPVRNRSLPRVLGRFLRDHVPANKLMEYALHGPPETTSECDRRRVDLRNELRNWSWFLRLAVPGILALQVLAMGRGFLDLCQAPGQFPHLGWWILAMATCLAALLGMPISLLAVVLHLRNRRRKQLLELESWRHHNEASSPSVRGTTLAQTGMGQTG